MLLISRCFKHFNIHSYHIQTHIIQSTYTFQNNYIQNTKYKNKTNAFTYIINTYYLLSHIIFIFIYTLKYRNHNKTHQIQYYTHTTQNYILCNHFVTFTLSSKYTQFQIIFNHKHFNNNIKATSFFI